MQRLFNIAFLVVIAFALVVQTAGFGVAVSGASPDFLGRVGESLGAAVMPAMLIAAIKFLLNLVRSFRDPSARVLAACYALVLAWPVVLRAVLTITSVTAITVAAPGGGRELRSTAAATEPYHEGRAWAQEHNPLRRPECVGPAEFVRGCTEWIDGQRQVQARAGSEWAREHQPARASQCEGTPDFVLGCRTWFFQQLAPPKQPGQGPFGTSTTEACRVEVDAHYRLAQELDLIEGKERDAEAIRARDWDPDLRACEALGR